MIVIVGLIVLVAAVVVGIVGLLSNAGPTHQMTEPFSVFGYHVTGSTGTLFLLGIVVGAVGMLGLSVLLAGARRTAERGRDARRRLVRSQRETSFINRDRADLLEHQQHDGASASRANGVNTSQSHTGMLSRWRGRQSAAATSTDRSW
jgi:hypothetical protein